MKITFKIILTIAFAWLWSYECLASATITGYYPSLKDGDKVVLNVNPYGMPNFTGLDKAIETTVKNHEFSFWVPTGKFPIRYSMKFMDSKIQQEYSQFYLQKRMSNQYLEDKDDVKILESSDSLRFTGYGAYKYEVIRKLQQNDNAFNQVNFQVNPLYSVKERTSLTLANLKYLDKIKGMISQDVYTLLLARVIGTWYNQTTVMWTMDSDKRKAIIEELKDEKFDRPFNNDQISYINQSRVIAYDDIYTWGIYYKYLFDHCYRKEADFQIQSYYTFLKDNYDGILLERLIANVLFYRRTEPEDSIDLLNDALSFVKDSTFKSILLSLKNERMRGADAYNFSLVDEKGKIHKMTDFKGKVVFIDFWFTGCGNCIRVRPYIEKLEEKFKGKPVAFLSISIDNTMQQWLKGIKSGIYTTKGALNLFSGEGGINSELSKHYNVSGGPTLLLIDKNGKLMTSPLDPRADNGENISQAIIKELN